MVEVGPEEGERRKGHRPYLIPGRRPGSGARRARLRSSACSSWQLQLLELGQPVDYLYVSSGSGRHLRAASCLGGARMYSAPYRGVVGVSPGGRARPSGCARASPGRPTRARACSGSGSTGLAGGRGVEHDEYVGPGYGDPRPRLARRWGCSPRTEGLLLDPVYTAKATAGLIDHVRRAGRPGPDRRVPPHRRPAVAVRLRGRDR